MKAPNKGTFVFQYLKQVAYYNTYFQIINSVPSQFQKWMEKNSGRIDAANNRGTLPYWIQDNSKFAGMKINPINTAAQPEIRKAAAEKYNSYGSEWEKAYFDKYSGGYIVTDKQRIEHSKISKNESAKFKKEFEMAMVFAKNGHKIEMLNEIPRIPSPDIKINGILADLKRVSGHNNIIKYASKAINTQGANLILFQFDKMDELVLGAIEALKMRKIKGMYFVTNENRIFEF